LKIVWSSGAKAPEKMHLTPVKWAACSCSRTQTSSWYSNDLLLNSSSAITNCFRMEACLELILASQCKPWRCSSFVPPLSVERPHLGKSRVGAWLQETLHVCHVH
jgi:hypothetical protein